MGRPVVRHYFGLIAIALVVVVGCENHSTEPDGPVPNGAIEANPSSIRTTQRVAFTFSASGAPLDSIVVDYGDRSRELYPCGGKTSVSISIGHTFTFQGTITITMRVHSGKKKAVVTKDIYAALDSPPVVRSLSIDVPEGDSLTLCRKDIIFDREGDPFQYTISVSDPHLRVRERGDSLVIKGIDKDYYGSGFITVRYSYLLADSTPRVGTQDIWVFINERDCIKGRVADIMTNTLAAEKDPALVLMPPFRSGSVIVDGKQAAVDLTTGQFTSPKLTPFLPHQVICRGFSNALGESSYTVTREFQPGDREETISVHTTAGTGLSLAELREFYWQANFRVSVHGLEGLHTPHSTRRTLASDYLASKGIVIEGGSLQGLTSDQQEQVAGWITEEFDAILPPEYSIPIRRGVDADTLPVVQVEGGVLPAPYTGVAFVQSNSGSIQLSSVFTQGFFIDRAWIRLRYDPATVAAIARGWALGAFLARRAAPGLIVTGQRFGGKSCLAVDGAGPADHLTGADKKLLWLTVLHPAGTSLDACLQR
jgi:hypothetical protein